MKKDLRIRFIVEKYFIFYNKICNNNINYLVEVDMVVTFDNKNNKNNNNNNNNNTVNYMIFFCLC